VAQDRAADGLSPPIDVDNVTEHTACRGEDALIAEL
jgi:hypothetical protein